MTTQELIKLLEDFIHLPGENEVVEFKKAQNGFNTQKLGEYFSALSNEANLGQEEFAWLLFGIHDKTHTILGSSYKPTRPSLDALKREIAEGTNCGITFTEIHEIMYQGKRVIMFQIPAAPKGIPTSYKGHYYGRDGESLVALSLHELESIRNQSQQPDWSAQIVKGATFDDLDSKAISIARSLYIAKNKKNAAEIAEWDDITFLNKAKLTIKGKITNAAQDLSLVEIEALNRIQLNRSISDEEVSHLRKKKLIEGRKPNLFIAKPVAQQLDQKTAYSSNKGFEDSYYCDLILKALTEHEILTREEITKLLWKKLPDILNDSQKLIKIKNLLSKLRSCNKIVNQRQGSISNWQLKKE